jgi:BlaI family transcriptional regulator, penicillinase repressor
VPRQKLTGAPLTPLELEIMNVLWETGPAGVQTVQARLQGRDLAYTTVQTMLNVLHRKGRVKRRLQERAFLYTPLLSRQTAVTQAVGDMIERFFGGSADSLVMNLVETRKLTTEGLAELQKLVEQSKEKSHGDD